MNLVKLAQNSGMRDSEVVELLKIANGYLPRVRLEYDRVKEEINSAKAELNSLKAETTNLVRTYQDFCDRNLELKNREDELQLTIKELETTKVELQKTALNESLPVFHECNTYNDNLCDENGISHCSPVSSLSDNSAHQYPPFQCKSTKAIIGFSKHEKGI